MCMRLQSTPKYGLKPHPKAHMYSKQQQQQYTTTTTTTYIFIYIYVYINRSTNRMFCLRLLVICLWTACSVASVYLFITNFVLYNFFLLSFLLRFFIHLMHAYCVRMIVLWDKKMEISRAFLCPKVIPKPIFIDFSHY